MWTLAGFQLKSRIFLGTGRYPSPRALANAIECSGTEVVTVSLRRENPAENQGHRFWDFLKNLHVKILPNTAGCHTVQEAVNTARLARSLFGTNWVKLEVIGNDLTLQPDPFGLVEAARILVGEGFEVFPYTSDDLIVAEQLLRVGCKILMPWGAPIGSGQGLLNKWALKTLRGHFPRVPMIIDAGLGKPSHATEAMELGFDGILLNTAVALSPNPPLMARAFSLAVQAGRKGYEAGLMVERPMAEASSPLAGKPFRISDDPGFCL